ncbi:MAG: ribonuclease HII [Armatimonadetes bacterium]|nr:ribonuclease HII [Armatimonadota bacterium]
MRVSWAGADEAGRGPLAGPVVAAAVILPRRFDATGINDSKLLTPPQREEAAARIKDRACYCIVVSEVAEIDRINILQASLLAMQRALVGLSKSPLGALIDGNQPVRDLPFPGQCVVKGDQKYAQIAAASILAKTYRDQLMRDLSFHFPEYGFDHNFGYSTPEHFRALDKYGPCALHRRSFAPIKERLQLCLEI